MTPSTDTPEVIARPPLLYVAALLVVLVLRRFWPLPVVSHAMALWPAVALVVSGLGILIWGRRALETAGTNTDPRRPATAIVTSGPFRFSRNPLYVSITLMYGGLTLAANTWWGAIVLVPLLVVVHRGVVLREERYLERKFGDAYRQYRSRVRRYF